MQQTTPPPFAAKFQRFLAIEFLTISVLVVLSILIYKFKGFSFSEDGLFSIPFYIYLSLLFFKLIYKSIKIVFFPNSSK